VDRVIDTFLVISTGFFGALCLAHWRHHPGPDSFSSIHLIRSAVFVSNQTRRQRPVWFTRLSVPIFSSCRRCKAAMALASPLFNGVCIYGYYASQARYLKPLSDDLPSPVTCLIASLFASVFAYRGADNANS